MNWDLIDRQALKAKAICPHGLNQRYVSEADIDAAPAVKVPSVEEGRWEQGDIYDLGDVCSRCEYDSHIEFCSLNYCPNCGLKMKARVNCDERIREKNVR